MSGHKALPSQEGAQAGYAPAYGVGERAETPYHPKYEEYKYGAEAEVPQGYLGGWINFGHPDYVKGFVVGAVLAFLATNPAVQKAMVSGAVKVWNTIAGGVEEIKEKVRDVQAEIKAKKE